MTAKPAPAPLIASSSAPLIAPTAEVWRTMSPAERERFLVRVLDSLSDPVAAMSEGRPHWILRASTAPSAAEALSGP